MNIVLHMDIQLELLEMQRGSVHSPIFSNKFILDSTPIFFI